MDVTYCGNCAKDNLPCSNGQILLLIARSLTKLHPSKPVELSSQSLGVSLGID